MVKEATSKINRVGPRHTVYLQKDLVEDTAFPFHLNEPLTVRVDGGRLVIERAGGRAGGGSSFVLPDIEAESVLSVPEVLSILNSLGFSQLLSKAEKIYEMLKEVHEAETLELRVRHIPPGEHAILLYRGSEFRDRIITEYFDSAVDAPMGFLSEKPTRLESAKNLLYNQLGRGKSTFPEDIVRWISDLHSSNRSSEATRIAIEDLSWLMEKQLTTQALTYEREIGARLKRNMTVLCGYRSSVLEESWLRKLLALHTYVILDSPFRVYKRGPL